MAKGDDSLFWIVAAGVAGYFVYTKYFQASATSTATQAAATTATGPVSSAVAPATSTGPVSTSIVLPAPVPIPTPVGSPASTAQVNAAPASGSALPAYSPPYFWGRNRPIPLERLTAD